jgi:hypothetical protein
MAHIYYHGVKNSGSSGGDGGEVLAGLLLFFVLILGIIGLFYVPILICTFIVTWILMESIPEEYHGNDYIRYWPLVYLTYLVFNEYDIQFHPKDIHGWFKILYYLIVFISSVLTTFGLNYLIILKQKELTHYLLQGYRAFRWMPLACTYIINFDWTNNLIYTILNSIWRAFLWIGSLAG